MPLCQTIGGNALRKRPLIRLSFEGVVTGFELYCVQSEVLRSTLPAAASPATLEVMVGNSSRSVRASACLSIRLSVCLSVLPLPLSVSRLSPSSLLIDGSSVLSIFRLTVISTS